MISVSNQLQKGKSVDDNDFRTRALSCSSSSGGGRRSKKVISSFRPMTFYDCLCVCFHFSLVSTPPLDYSYKYTYIIIPVDECETHFL